MFTAPVLSLAGFVIACGVIWRGLLRPGMRLIRELIELLKDIRDLLKTDEKGRGLPQRVTDLEQLFADFIASLKPMVETIALLATPPRRTHRKAD